MNNELKPCPFCGCKAIIMEFHSCVGVLCINVKCRVRITRPTKKSVLKVWNTRTGEPNDSAK